MKNFFTYLIIVFSLNSCGGGDTYQDPARYDSQLIDIMKKHALRGSDYHAVVDSPSSHETPYVYSNTSFERAKTNGLNDCGRKYNNCYVYKLKYLGHDPYIGFIYTENTKKIAKKKLSVTKKTPTKKKSSKKELSFEEIMQGFFGDRDLNNLDNIEGVWRYRRDDEKEARVYLLISSDDYLYKEIVLSHPVRKFEGQISTKIIKKINENLYQTKATWLNQGEVSERDGTIKIIDKFKLKFETSRHCYSSEKKCLKAGIVYKKKVWPSKTYSDEANLSKEQTEVLRGLLD